MDAGTLAKLLSREGRALLSALPPYDEKQAMVLAEGLRKRGVDPDLAAAALTQTRLRAKAAAKLGPFADGMYFTPDGLEQATRLTVAALHARRYVAAGVTRVADLTCGIGADSLAFAGVGLEVLATDIDLVTAMIAKVNLRPFPEAEVRHLDGLSLDLAVERVDGIYADPARRKGGKRIFDPAAYAPPLDAVWALRSQASAVGIKVGPGVPHQGLPEDAEVQWVSVDGDVVEAGLWFGPLALDGPGRSALLLREHEGRTLSRELRAAPPSVVEPAEIADAGTSLVSTRAASDPTQPTDPGRLSRERSDRVETTTTDGGVGEYVYEPDGAVIRAGLVAEAAAELGGCLLNPTIAYITTDSPAPAISVDPALGQAPIATGYRVLDTMPFGVKRLKAYLRERDVGRVTIKKRGTAVTPETLRPQLSLRGNNEATIILTRIGPAQSILIVEPLSQQPA
ncbi:MAG: class I SAM-dependent methyltransferase [Promicromonosporaceae bacterium]|nr:class I SAM-dependent methyltransferase [Promicromonosporaceae bacterium]